MEDVDVIDVAIDEVADPRRLKEQLAAAVRRIWPLIKKSRCLSKPNRRLRATPHRAREFVLMVGSLTLGGEVGDVDPVDAAAALVRAVVGGKRWGHVPHDDRTESAEARRFLIELGGHLDRLTKSARAQRLLIRGYEEAYTKLIVPYLACPPDPVVVIEEWLVCHGRIGTAADARKLNRGEAAALAIDVWDAIQMRSGAPNSSDAADSPSSRASREPNRKLSVKRQRQKDLVKKRRKRASVGLTEAPRRLGWMDIEDFIADKNDETPD